MSRAAYELNKGWREDGHPHERDENGFCTTCGAVKGEGHYKCLPPVAKSQAVTSILPETLVKPDPELSINC